MYTESIEGVSISSSPRHIGNKDIIHVWIISSTISNKSDKNISIGACDFNLIDHCGMKHVTRQDKFYSGGIIYPMMSVQFDSLVSFRSNNGIIYGNCEVFVYSKQSESKIADNAAILEINGHKIPIAGVVNNGETACEKMKLLLPTMSLDTKNAVMN